MTNFSIEDQIQATNKNMSNMSEKLMKKNYELQQTINMLTQHINILEKEQAILNDKIEETSKNDIQQLTEQIKNIQSEIFMLKHPNFAQ